MIKNSVTLMGRVGKFQDVKYCESGAVITTIQLGVKHGNSDKWSNFFIKFFDNERAVFSEWVMNNIKEGDYIQVNGSLKVNEYVPQGADPEKDKKSRIDITGYGISKVIYNQQIEDWMYATHGGIYADGREPIARTKQRCNQNYSNPLPNPLPKGEGINGGTLPKDENRETRKSSENISNNQVQITSQVAKFGEFEYSDEEIPF